MIFFRRNFFHIKNLKDFRKFWFFQKYFFGKFSKIFFDQKFSIFFDEIFFKPHLLIQKDTVKLISNKLKPFKPSDWIFLKNIFFCKKCWFFTLYGTRFVDPLYNVHFAQNEKSIAKSGFTVLKTQPNCAELPQKHFQNCFKRNIVRLHGWGRQITVRIWAHFLKIWKFDPKFSTDGTSLPYSSFHRVFRAWWTPDSCVSES